MTLPIGTHDRRWHEERLDGIGGSDAPVILGLSSYKRPIELWREKVDRIIPDETETALRLRIGNLVEPVILDLYAEQTGRKVQKVRATKWSKLWPFAYVHLDGRVVGERRIVQAKTASQFDGREWGEPGEGPTAGLPPDIYVQELHELAVSGADFADVAVLKGFGKFTIYPIERDQEAIDELMEVESQFFLDVRAKREPPIDGSEAYARHLREKFPRDEGIIRLATPEEDVAIANLEHASHNLKAIEAVVDEAKNRLRAIIGDDAGIEGESGRVTWKAQTSKRTDYKEIAGAYRVLLDLYIAQFGNELGDDRLDRLILTDLDTFEGIHTSVTESRVLRGPK